MLNRQLLKTSKNVIIMIGDGMGPQQVGLLNAYAKYAPNSGMGRIPIFGLCYNIPHG
jgi:alkaline phosphatase